MRFLLDESADYPLAAHLLERGHDVTAVAHDYPHALADRTVLAIAHHERRMLITHDRDFGELIFRQHLPHAVVLLFRLGEESLATKISRLDHVLSAYAEQLNQFLVITDQGVRVRRITQ
jgi:predicted nuclease of predicted toxin-antitoxin system